MLDEDNDKFSSFGEVSVLLNMSHCEEVDSSIVVYCP